MRLGLISDIHGNAIALEAVMADLQEQSVDAVICLGDIATLGARPRQTLAAVRAQGWACVRGNHDAALLDLERAADYHIGPPLHATLRWCARQLSEEDLSWLRPSPATLRLPLGAGADLLAFHGSPRSNVDVILAETPAETLEQLLGGQAAAVMAGGHTHIQLLRQHQGRLQTVSRRHVIHQRLDPRPLRRGWTAPHGDLEGRWLARWIHRFRADGPSGLGGIIQPRQHPLGWRIALCRRQPEPRRSLSVVPRHAAAVGVHPAQLVLRLDMASAGCRAVQPHRPVIIPGHAFAMLVTHRPFHLHGRGRLDELEPVRLQTRRLRTGSTGAEQPKSKVMM